MTEFWFYLWLSEHPIESTVEAIALLAATLLLGTLFVYGVRKFY